MTLGDVGLLLQGIGSVLFALATSWLGLRASKVLRIRVEGPVRGYADAFEPRSR
jgi:homoaconitase/3-isopropylmalate dehydratase large subunit